MKELYALAGKSAKAQDDRLVPLEAAEGEALVKAYCRNGDVEAARRLIKQLPEEDLRPHTYGHLLHW